MTGNEIEPKIQTIDGEKFIFHHHSVDSLKFVNSKLSRPFVYLTSVALNANALDNEAKHTATVRTDRSSGFVF